MSVSTPGSKGETRADTASVHPVVSTQAVGTVSVASSFRLPPRSPTIRHHRTGGREGATLRDAAYIAVIGAAKQPVVYDVLTGELIDVDPVLAEVLPIYGTLVGTDLEAALGGRHAPAAVRAAVAEIERARREEGLFLAMRPRAEAPLWSDEDDAVWNGGMRHLVLELTEACNLRCTYCLHGTARPDVRPHGSRRMGIGTAIAALRWFAARCTEAESPCVSFYGGEPLLALPTLRAILDESDCQRTWPAMRFVIDTNGTLLTNEVIDLVASRKLWVQLSLDGPATVHDRHRHDGEGGTTHAAIEASLVRLLRRDPTAQRRLTIQATLAPPYDLRAVCDYFGDFPPFHAAGIAATPLVRVAVADLEGVALGEASDRQDLSCQMADARRAYLTACREGRRDATSAALLSLFDPIVIAACHRSRAPLTSAAVGLGGNCRPGVRKVHVAVDGTLRVCERLGLTGVIGDVTTGVDPGSVRALRARFRAAVGDRCTDCVAVRACSVCWRDLDRGAQGIPEARCAASRRDLLAGLALYRELLAGPETAWRWLERCSMS